MHNLATVVAILLGFLLSVEGRNQIETVQDPNSNGTIPPTKLVDTIPAESIFVEGGPITDTKILKSHIVGRKGVDNETEDIKNLTISTVSSQPNVSTTLERTNISGSVTTSNSSTTRNSTEKSIITPTTPIILNNNVTVLTPTTKPSNNNNRNETNKILTNSTEPSSTTVKPLLPSKPKITISVEDDPSILNVPFPNPSTNGKLSVDEPDLPKMQQTIEQNDHVLIRPLKSFENDQSQYIILIVTLIFAVPMVMAMGIIIIRRLKYHWSVRHYRRMDFLVDGMYND